MSFSLNNNVIYVKVFCCLPAAAHRHRADPPEQREGAASSPDPHRRPVGEHTQLKRCVFLFDYLIVILPLRGKMEDTGAAT